MPKVQLRSHDSTCTGSTADASTSRHPLRCTHADAPVGHLRRPFHRNRSSRRVLLEVHRDVYHRESGSAESVVRAWSEALGVAHSIDWAKVRIVIGMRDGMPHVVSAASGAEFDSSAAHAGIVSAAHHFD